MRCGKGIGMWERFGKCKRERKKTAGIRPISAKALTEGSAVKTLEAAVESDK